MDEEGVEGDLHEDVEGVDAGQGDSVDGHGADGVEEDLESTEECLAEDGVEHESLEGRGQVSIKPIDAKRLVVS